MVVLRLQLMCRVRRRLRLRLGGGEWLDQEGDVVDQAYA